MLDEILASGGAALHSCPNSCSLSASPWQKNSIIFGPEFSITTPTIENSSPHDINSAVIAERPVYPSSLESTAAAQPCGNRAEQITADCPSILTIPSSHPQTPNSKPMQLPSSER
jgi:hypothetical protein